MNPPPLATNTFNNSIDIATFPSSTYNTKNHNFLFTLENCGLYFHRNVLRTIIFTFFLVNLYNNSFTQKMLH